MTKHILVIDDAKDIVEIYRRILTTAGYEVICAYNGKEGLETLRANPKVDLIVLDLKMPKMTGDEFLKILRNDLELRHTKVLIMSSFLYRYKEIPRYDPTAQRVVRRDRVRDTLTSLGQKAEKTGQADGQLEMEEKTESRLEQTWFGKMPENEADFEKRVSEDLLKRVKTIFGEPYQKEKTKSSTVVEERVKDIIAKWLKVEKEKLTWNSTSFAKDLGIAFVDAMSLRRKIEKEFGIKISYEKQIEIETVGDLIRHIHFEKEYARSYKDADRKILADGLIKPILFFLGLGLLSALFVFLWLFFSKKQ